MEGNRVRVARRRRRRQGIRKRVRGSGDCPRLSVFRSDRHIYVQLIDDQRGITLCEASTRDKSLRSEIAYGGNAAAAKMVGEALGKRALEKSISRACFDRNGYRYHGRVKVLADAVREAGVKF